MKIKRIELTDTDAIMVFDNDAKWNIDFVGQDDIEVQSGISRPDDLDELVEEAKALLAFSMGLKALEAELGELDFDCELFQNDGDMVITVTMTSDQFNTLYEKYKV